MLEDMSSITEMPHNPPAEQPNGEPRKRRRRRGGRGRSRRGPGEGGAPGAELATPGAPESGEQGGAHPQGHDGAHAPAHGDEGGHGHHQEGQSREPHHAPRRKASVPLTEHNIEVFDTSLTFRDLGLNDAVLQGTDGAGFKHPTFIQAKLMPPMIAGKDVLGQAKTGTGKTASFGLPLLQVCDPNTQFQALVLAPTRELAIQITEEINTLGRFTPIRATTIYGGQAIRNQAEKLKKGSQIIVGTPGRVMDMVERGLLHFNNIKFAILDEVDRMLDIGFREDIRRILEMCPPSDRRQTVMVSATISGDIERLARRYMRDPEKIVTSAGSLTVSLVEQHYLAVQPWDKKRLLLHLLKHEEPALTLVFCRLKRSVDELSMYLTRHGVEAHAMHGDMSQGKRNSTMQMLRGGNLACLIASDLASRGIDVEGISHVINYDLPEDPDVYVHRIGRTARAGRGGVAWSLVTPAQGELLTQIELLINAEIPKMDYPDFKPTDRPEGFRDVSKGGRPEVVIEGVPDAPKVSRTQMAVAPPMPVSEPNKVDLAKFPGGIVPTKMPPRRLFGKMPGRRP